MIKENYLSYPASIKEAMGLQVDWQSKNPIPPTPPIPEGFVDFGLPSGTLWYNKNLGATNGNTVESWYGNYYAWGELETKTYYNWADPEDATQNYKYANGSYDNTLTKYCNNSEYGNEGYTDELTQLVASDDAAKVVNISWKMPTKEDFEELLAGTSNTWEEDYNNIEGLNGRLFIKTTITRPAFKNINLYTMFDENLQPVETPTEISNKMWDTISRYTKDELDQLISQKSGGQITDVTTIIFKDQVGTPAEYDTNYGFVVKQTDPSVSMFIPAAGYCDGFSLDNAGSYGYYWSSSLYLGNPNRAWYLGFNSDYIFMNNGNRYYGQSLRPVLLPVLL